MYRFEHKITTKNASQPGGRLAYAGLSGGFGTLTVGQIWNAAYNHAGAITDKSYYFGNSTTGYRHGNALSYAHSTGPVSFQLDLISDGDMNTGQGIDKTEFGMTVALGEIGKVALAHTNMRDKTVTKMTERIPGTPYVPEKIITAAVPGTPAVPAVPEKYYVTVGDGDDAMEHEVKRITVHLTGALNVAANVEDGVLTAAGLDLIERTDSRYHGTGALATECKELVDADDGTADDCVEVTAYVQTTEETGIRRAPGAPADGTRTVTTTTVTETFHAKPTRTADAVAAVPAVDPVDAVVEPAVPGKEEVPPMPYTDTEPGFKNTHVAVEFNVGGMTPYLGHSTKKMNGAMGKKTKTTHYGVSGGLGDTGVNFLVAARSVDEGGTKTSPWLFNVSKNLGGGATVIFEHANYDSAAPGDKETAIGLHVSF